MIHTVAARMTPSTRRDSGSRLLASDRDRTASGAVDARSVGRRTNESRRRSGGLRGAVRKFRVAVREFRRGEHGGVAVESAVAIMVLVVGFAGLMEIVNASYTGDRVARAARAAARVLALDPSADPKATACAAIQRELELAEDFDCETAWWTLDVKLGVAPSALPATLDAGATTGSGDMVVVWIDWNRDVWSFDGPLLDANADDDAADAGTVRMVAIGIARCEADLCGQGTP